MKMEGLTTGICPNCGEHKGEIGDKCPADVCTHKGYTLIPKPWYDASKDFSSKKGKPIDPFLGRYIDKYLLAGIIGEGAMGAVYYALQRPLKHEVALKVISGIEITDETIKRFEREARAISILSHPNIVKLHDYGVSEIEDCRLPYMVLEYVRDGRSLRRAFAEMKRRRPEGIPAKVVLIIFKQILNALSAAHQQGIIHRDIKPENILLVPVAGNPYLVKVLDFGLAKAVWRFGGFEERISRTGDWMGTPLYMAPEQAPSICKWYREVDHRADLYAVSVMLFEVFTGVEPFTGETLLDLMLNKVDSSYDPLSLPEASKLPESVRSFLKCGMSPEPEGRFSSAEEMLHNLENALSIRETMAVGYTLEHRGPFYEKPTVRIDLTNNGVDDVKATLRTEKEDDWLDEDLSAVAKQSYETETGKNKPYPLGDYSEKEELVSPKVEDPKNASRPTVASDVNEQVTSVIEPSCIDNGEKLIITPDKGKHVPDHQKKRGNFLAKWWVMVGGMITISMMLLAIRLGFYPTQEDTVMHQVDATSFYRLGNRESENVEISSQDGLYTLGEVVDDSAQSIETERAHQYLAPEQATSKIRTVGENSLVGKIQHVRIAQKKGVKTLKRDGLQKPVKRSIQEPVENVTRKKPRRL